MSQYHLTAAPCRPHLGTKNWRTNHTQLCGSRDKLDCHDVLNISTERCLFAQAFAIIWFNDEAQTGRRDQPSRPTSGCGLRSTHERSVEEITSELVLVVVLLLKYFDYSNASKSGQVVESARKAR